MNAQPAQPLNSTPTSARAAGTERSSAGSGFAGLFERFQLAETTAQAEPTALPEQALLPTEPDEGTDSAATTDVQLLAALGLAPLPSEPPATLAPGLLGGLSGAFSGHSEGLASGDLGALALGEASTRGPRATTLGSATLATASGPSLPATSPMSAVSVQASGVQPLTMLATAATETATTTTTATSAPSDSTLPPALAVGQAVVSSDSAERAAPVLAQAQSGAPQGKAPSTPAVAGSIVAGSARPAAEALLSPNPGDLAAEPPPATNAAPRAAADFRASPMGAPPAGTTPATETGSLDKGLALAAALNARSADSENANGNRSAQISTASASIERADFGNNLREALSPSTPPPLPPSSRLDPATPQFSGMLSQQIAWLANQKLGRAEIRLHPEELGPLEVAIDLDGDEIRAEFSSRSAEVRSLLESQVPKLRELLAEQGFSLADAQVGQERAAYSDAHAQRANFKGEASDPPANPADAASATPVITTRARLGLVDDYA